MVVEDEGGGGVTWRAGPSRQDKLSRGGKTCCSCALGMMRVLELVSELC